VCILLGVGDDEEKAALDIQGKQAPQQMKIA
jgi:hypothetical protein